MMLMIIIQWKGIPHYFSTPAVVAVVAVVAEAEEETGMHGWREYETFFSIFVKYLFNISKFSCSASGFDEQMNK